MQSITTEAYADFSHALFGYSGKCAQIHGHTWKFELQVSAHELDSLGMVMDFKKLKKLIAPAIDVLDHSTVLSSSFVDTHRILPYHTASEGDLYPVQRETFVELTYAGFAKCPSSRLWGITNNGLPAKLVVSASEPTSEYFARWFGKYCAALLPKNLHASRVRVYESIAPYISCAEWRPEH